MIANSEQTVWSRVNKRAGGGCWEWEGCVVSTGYGTMPVRGKTYRVHRLAWLLTYGSLTPGLVIDHLCRNKLCCNPSHMEEVTPRENVLRGIGPTATNKRKTHCLRGHELTSENCYPFPDEKRAHYRECKQCRKIRRCLYKAKKKA